MWVKAQQQNNLLPLMKSKHLQGPIDCVDIFRGEGGKNIKMLFLIRLKYLIPEHYNYIWWPYAEQSGM